MYMLVDRFSIISFRAANIEFCASQPGNKKYRHSLVSSGLAVIMVILGIVLLTSPLEELGLHEHVVCDACTWMDMSTLNKMTD